MSADSGSADREVWQVMCGGMEPRFDTSVGATSSGIAVTAGGVHPSASWPNTSVAETWNPAAVTNPARGWGHPRIESDDACLEGSLTSMMRGIADEGMATMDKTFSWGAPLHPVKPGGEVGQESSLHWNSLVAGGDQNVYDPFSGGNAWSFFPNSGSTTETSKTKWDMPGAEKNSEATEPSTDSTATVSQTDNAPRLASSSTEMPEEHSRSSSITVVASETSLSTIDAGSNVGGSQPTASTSQAVESSNNVMIEKLINSNEGWGQRPVRQDVPWVIDDSMETGATSADVQIPDASRDPQKAVPVGVQAEMPSAGLYWGNIPPRNPAPATDFGSDNDIGLWNGPPEGGNSGLWGGLPKDGGWPGMSSMNVADPGSMLSGPPPPLGSVPPFGLASHLLETASCPGVPASFIDMMLTGNREGVPHGPVDAGWPQMLEAQRQNSDGSGRDHISPPSVLQKIDSWNDQFAAMSGQGMWNQPPPGAAVMPPYQSQFQSLPAGMKKEDVIQFSQPQRGRMLRGQSTNEAAAVGGGFVFPDVTAAAAQSSRASAFQPVFNSAMPPPAHRKQQSGGAGWPGAFSQPPAATPQLNAAALQKMLELQGILQPLLNERSAVQQSKTLTPVQRRQALDRLNPTIDAIKRQMDQLQAMPMPAMPPSTDVAALGDVGSLLSRLRLDADAAVGMIPGMQLPPGSAEMRAVTGQSSPGAEAFAGSWMGMTSAPGQTGFPAGAWPDVHAGVPRGIRGTAPGMQQIGGNTAGRSALWSPQYSAGPRMPDAAKASTSPWLKLTNISPRLDGQVVQMLCTQYGQLSTFLYNKATSNAFACFAVADNARRACTAFGAGAPGTVPLFAEVVAPEIVSRLLEGQQAAGWVQLPPAANGSQMPVR